MNVDGLAINHIKSHLQTYRNDLKSSGEEGMGLVYSDNEAASGGEDVLALGAGGRLRSYSLPPKGRRNRDRSGGSSAAGAMYALPPQDNGGGGGGGTSVAPVMRPAGGAARTPPSLPRPLQPLQFEGVAATMPIHGGGTAAMMLPPGRGTKMQCVGSSSRVGQQRLVGGGGGGQDLHGGVGGAQLSPSAAAAAAVVTMPGSSSSATHRKMLKEALVFQMGLQKKLYEQHEVTGDMRQGLGTHTVEAVLVFQRSYSSWRC